MYFCTRLDFNPLFMYLVSLGADISATTDAGVTILMSAIENKNKDIVNYILNSGYDVREVTAIYYSFVLVMPLIQLLL